VQSENSKTCPLTLDVLKDPVRNSYCGHTFSRFAIEEYIRNTPRRKEALCPVAGCKEIVRVESLERDIAAEFEQKRSKPNKKKTNVGRVKREESDAIDFTQDKDKEENGDKNKEEDDEKVENMDINESKESKESKEYDEDLY